MAQKESIMNSIGTGEARSHTRGGDPVLVQTEKFRCMACLGNDGKWRSYYGGEELTGRVQEAPTCQGNGLQSQAEWIVGPRSAYYLRGDQSDRFKLGPDFHQSTNGRGLAIRGFCGD
jgi:hypothetical protein